MVTAGPTIEDAVANRLIAQHGDPSHHSVIKIANGMMGPDSVRLVPAGDLFGGAALEKRGGRFYILVDAELPKTERAFAIGHELAHWMYYGAMEPDLEARCDRLGAAFAVPRLLFLEELTRGRCLESVASTFHVTPTCAALRYSEVLGVPMTVVSPAKVRRRGYEYPWPSDTVVRQWGRRGAPRGVIARPLSATRVAYVANIA